MKYLQRIRSIFVFCTLCMTIPFNLLAQPASISITSPQQDSEVSNQELIIGTASNVEQNIYVLLHPMTTNMWFVQNLPGPVNEDGRWQTLCYFGVGSQGINDYYEITAIVTDMTLQAAQILETIPQDVIRSNTITVYRTE